MSISADSDPLSSLRNDWVGSTSPETTTDTAEVTDVDAGADADSASSKKASNLEEALKSLSIDNCASSTTRKF